MILKCEYFRMRMPPPRKINQWREREKRFEETDLAW